LAQPLAQAQKGTRTTRKERVLDTLFIPSSADFFNPFPFHGKQKGTPCVFPYDRVRLTQAAFSSPT